MLFPKTPYQANRHHHSYEVFLFLTDLDELALIFWDGRSRNALTQLRREYPCRPESADLVIEVADAPEWL